MPDSSIVSKMEASIPEAGEPVNIHVTYSNPLLPNVIQTWTKSYPTIALLMAWPIDFETETGTSLV